MPSRLSAGIAVVAVIGVLGLAASASADTINVPGRDGKSIQQAVNRADPGDRIRIEARNRRYFENVVVTTNRLRIVGVPNRNGLPVIDGTNRAGTIDAPVFDIDANRVSLGRVSAQHGFGIDCTGKACHIANVQVRMSDQGFNDCIEIDGVLGRVAGSTFRGCDRSAIDIAGNRGRVVNNEIRQVDSDCVVVAGDRAVVTNNDVQNCEDADGIRVIGNEANVLTNSVQNTDDNAFEVTGRANFVGDNDATGIESDCFNVDGKQARVVGNFAAACDGGWEVSGENMFVANNFGVFLGDDDGFDVDCFDQPGGQPPARACHRTAVLQNRADGNNNDDEGFDVFIAAGTGGGAEIIGNDSANNNDGGFSIFAVNARIANNRSSFDGAEGNEPGIEIRGARNIVIGNRAVASGEHGIDIDSGNGHNVRRNVSRLANVDGIHVSSGAGTTLKQNRAIDNAGDGIENDGVQTRVIGNKSHGNRKDCTNDGTIAAKRRNRCEDGSDFNEPGGLDRARARR